MVIRPLDANGDIEPVLLSGDLIKNERAVAILIKDRLDLYVDDWWENRGWGNSILNMLKESRLTESDMQMLGTYITSYIRETEDVQDVKDVKLSVSGREFSYSGLVITNYGNVNINYSL